MGYASYLEDTTRRLDEIRHALSSLRRDLGSSSVNSWEEIRLERIDETIRSLTRTIDGLLEVATDPSLKLSDLYLATQQQLVQQARVLRDREDELQRVGEIIRMNDMQLHAANRRIEELENERGQMFAKVDKMKAQLLKMDAQISQLRVSISDKDLEMQKLEKHVMPMLLAGDNCVEVKDKFR